MPKVKGNLLPTQLFRIYSSKVRTRKKREWYTGNSGSILGKQYQGVSRWQQVERRTPEWSRMMEGLQRDSIEN